MHHHHTRTHWHHLHARDAATAVVDAVLKPRATDSDGCSNNDTTGRCEKPTSDSLTLPITIGAAVPILIAVFVLIWLHRRHTQKLKREDAMDKTKSMDFGMDIGPASKLPKVNLPDGEKGESRSRHQLSLDMEINSPYLMPDIHDSHESLTSLARTMTGHSPSERRRSITDTLPRSHRSRSRDSSYYAHSLRPDDSPDGSESMHAELLSSAQKMPTSTPPPPRSASLARNSTEPPVPRINVPSGPGARSPSPNGLPASPRDGNFAPQKSEENGVAIATTTIEIEEPKSPGYSSGIPSILQVGTPSPTFQHDLDFGEGIQFRLSSASVESDKNEPAPPQTPPNKVETARKSLAPGGFDNRRLSMGFRPLPPEGKPDDTAEERAMRIRSFYKEYFSVDDANAAGGPPPPIPHGIASHMGAAEYYEDGAIFDPDTGRFIIPGAKPFAEPPMRRAMTPPPRMPPRGGGPGPRAPSGASGRFMSPGPRAFSSASGRMPMPAPRRPVAPPKPLNLLPTPAKLREDAFASPTLFAPPVRINRDGSDTSSLLGGQRPYSPTVSPHVPLASAFNELAPLPTPHALRNSSTFTALDFAPPRKIFASEDHNSDAGSIRSNQSGRSAMQVHNIRNGAYRVSRLPQDVVPLRDQMADELKPTWGMRPGAN